LLLRHCSRANERSACIWLWKGAANVSNGFPSLHNAATHAVNEGYLRCWEERVVYLVVWRCGFVSVLITDGVKHPEAEGWYECISGLSALLEALSTALSAMCLFLWASVPCAGLKQASEEQGKSQEIRLCAAWTCHFGRGLEECHQLLEWLFSCILTAHESCSWCRECLPLQFCIH